MRRPLAMLLVATVMLVGVSAAAAQAQEYYAELTSVKFVGGYLLEGEVTLVCPEGHRFHGDVSVFQQTGRYRNPAMAGEFFYGTCTGELQTVAVTFEVDEYERAFHRGRVMVEDLVVHHTYCDEYPCDYTLLDSNVGAILRLT